MNTRKPVRLPGPPLTGWQAVFVRSGKTVFWVGFVFFVLGLFVLPGKHSNRGFEDYVIALALAVGGLVVMGASSLVRKIGTRLTGAPSEEEDEF